MHAPASPRKFTLCFSINGKASRARVLLRKRISALPCLARRGENGQPNPLARHLHQGTLGGVMDYYYENIDDYLKDVEESIDYLTNNIVWEEYKGESFPYISPPFITERITMLLFEAGDDLVMHYWIEHGRLLTKEELIYLVKNSLHISMNYHISGEKCDEPIQYVSLCYASISRLDRILLKNDSIPEVKRLLCKFEKRIIFSVIQWITAYQAYKFYRLGNYEFAVDFCAASQMASRMPTSTFDDYEDIEEAVRDMEKEKKRRAAEDGAKKRIEARFKEEIFIPSWQDWKIGDIEYETQTAFFEEMVKQSVQYFKDNNAKKQAVTIRTLQNWAASL